MNEIRCFAGTVDGSAAPFVFADAERRSAIFRPRGRLRLGRWIAGVVAAAGMMTAMAGAAEAIGLPGNYTGTAYGALADTKLGPLAVGLGRLAFLPCPCVGTNGQLRTNNLASVNVGTLVVTGAMSSTVTTTKTLSLATGTSTNEIAGVNLAGGLVKADVIKAVANVSANSATVTANATGTTFTNLVIAGQTISANVAPNTVIAVPNLGTVTIRKTSFSGNGTSGRSVFVKMIVINVGTNTLGLGVGAVIEVGVASIGFNRPVLPNLVRGQAYVTLANAAIGSDLQAKVGKQAFVTIPCAGTNGQTLTNDVASASVTNLLTLATGKSTAFGGVVNGATVAKTTSSVDSISLLGKVLGVPVLSATNIVASVQESRTGTLRTVSAAGSTFGSIKILGLPVSLNLSPNTTLNIPGFGTVIVNEQKLRSTGNVTSVSGISSVNGLHIKITTANVLGLPIGTEIIIAHAEAAADPH